MKFNKSNLIQFLVIALFAIFLMMGNSGNHNVAQPKNETENSNGVVSSEQITGDNQQQTEPTVTESKTDPINNSQTAQPQSLIKSDQSSIQCDIVNYLPDPDCTPGAIDPRVTQENINSTICVSGYTATVRPSTSITNKIKTERMEAYGDTDSPSNYELDHFIPLELGGSPDSVSNLFPEPYANPYGAREKDKVENYLHKQVCDGVITLQVAQQEIQSNWAAVYDSCCKSTNTSNQTAPVVQTSSKYYTSSYATSKYYYPESCSAWKSLSPSYLKAFDSLEALLSAYPSRTLSPQCQ